MRHRITNNGTEDLKVTDHNGIVWTMPPGASTVIDFKKICHGDKRARYSVEPVDE